MTDKIKEMYAFVAEDEAGIEGLVTYRDERFGWIPMICADMNYVHQLLDRVRDLATESGKLIRVIKLHHREEVMVVAPGKREGGGHAS